MNIYHASNAGHFLQSFSKSQTQISIFYCVECCFHGFVAKIIAVIALLGNTSSLSSLEQNTNLSFLQETASGLGPRSLSGYRFRVD